MLTIQVFEGSATSTASIHAKVGKAIRVRIVGVPEDADGVKLTLVGANVSNEPVSASPVPGGEWKAVLPGGHFVSTGRALYAVSADIGSESVPLGDGSVFID
ncbi:MAG: hypothetical protein IKF72_12640 [Kiritimatiellae bacterium]|nr:hypothetical protein [Kiritimatiellia bacterium]